MGTVFIHRPQAGPSPRLCVVQPPPDGNRHLQDAPVDGSSLQAHYSCSSALCIQLTSPISPAPSSLPRNPKEDKGVLRLLNLNREAINTELASDWVVRQEEGSNPHHFFPL